MRKEDEENKEGLNKYSICTTCGEMGWPEIEKPRGLGIWPWLFIVFAIIARQPFFAFLIFVAVSIYEIWRKKSARIICPVCKNPTVIPTDTPRGKELVQKQQLKAEKEKKPI